jgi:hypothetical protein
MSTSQEGQSPFNGPVEIGLRALCILSESCPAKYPLQTLVVFDYLAVHSDDIEGGPPGLHPRTPYRGGEILVRRSVLLSGLLLYGSRGLVEQTYEPSGVFYSATELSAGFLDALDSEYVTQLRSRALWVTETLGHLSEVDLGQIVRENVGAWGAEFVMDSVLWLEETN